MITYIQQYAPSIYKFFKDFFSALNNKKKGYSLKKLLAVGFFWLSAICVFRFTNSENVTGVLAILTAMITTLVITNSVAVHSGNKLEQQNTGGSDEQK